MARSFPSSLVVALVTLVAAGCAEDLGPSPDGVGSATEALAGFEKPGRVAIDADLAAPPAGSVSFWCMGAEWREDVRSPLYRGAEADFAVAAERLAGCGEEVTLTAHLVPDVGEALEVPLEPSPHGGPHRGRFVVPEQASRLEVWVRGESPEGCVTHDSDFGRNYTLPVHLWAPTLVRFGADWSVRTEGPLLRGGVVAIEYDIDRLPDCRVIYRGFPGWDVIAHAAFDGAPLPGHSVVRASGSGQYRREREPALAFFAIPWDASEVELWFENRQYPPTCSGWDSDYGANYRFPLVDADTLVAPPGARLVFAPEWHERATGPLFAGAEIEIEATPERFPSCGTDDQVVATARLQDGTEIVVPLTETTAAGARVGRVDLPAETTNIEVWLRALGPDGCEEHDSDFGRNYTFPVFDFRP